MQVMTELLATALFNLAFCQNGVSDILLLWRDVWAASQESWPRLQGAISNINYYYYYYSIQIVGGV